MPKPATADETRAVLEELPLPEETIKPEIPLIRCRVVYLGPLRNRSVCLAGQVSVEYYEAPDGAVEREIRADDGTMERRRFEVTKEAIDAGTSTYDFTTHDSRGRLIRTRLMPDTAPERLRGKPFCWVEHGAHLREFFLGPRDPETKKRTKEFEVLSRAEDQRVLQDYVRSSERARRQQESLYQEVRSA